MSLALAVPAFGQRQGPHQLERGLRILPDAPIKVFLPTGSVRVIGWDKDSLAVRAMVAPGADFFFGGGDRGVKLGVEDKPNGPPAGPTDLVMSVPTKSHLSIKVVTAAVDGRDVSGWFYSVSGRIELKGSASTLEVESLSGPVVLDVKAGWVRARTGRGALTIGGEVQDLNATSVSGPIVITTGGLERARFGSVSGDIRYAGQAIGNAVLDLDDHSGTIELSLGPRESMTLDLVSVQGSIANQMGATRASAVGDGSSLTLRLGAGGARLSARSFRGRIWVHPR
jgi:hypothetical protein